MSFPLLHENKQFYLETCDCPGSHSICTRHPPPPILFVYTTQLMFTGVLEQCPPSVTAVTIRTAMATYIGSEDW